MNLYDLAQQVLPVAQKAGELILEIYGKEDFQVEQKDDDSPVTIADKTSNDFICAALEKLTPNIPIVSEERPVEDFAIRSQYDYYWLVDPLDGTKEFINRNGDFTVNIALIHGKKTVLGVVFVPVQNKTYWAVKGHGAWEIHNDSKRQLFADTFKMSQSGLAIAITRSHFNQETANYIGEFTFPRLIAAGSSLKVIMVARGEAHLHPRFGPTMEWDTAAPQIILEEAGGQILKHDGSPFEYNQKDSLENPNYFVYGKLEAE
jgi:3'(2'), 5'-bisphosphate nucleotidase